MKLKLILLTAFIVGSQLFGTLTIAAQDNVRASFHYGTVGLVTTFMAAQIISPYAVLKQTSTISLSTLNKIVENNLATQVLKANHINKLGYFICAGLALTTLYSGWVLSSEWHHNQSRNSENDYKRAAGLNLLTGTLLGTVASFALNEYVKQYLR